MWTNRHYFFQAACAARLVAGDRAKPWGQGRRSVLIGLFLGLATLGQAAWTPDAADLAALKTNITAILPAAYALEIKSGDNEQPILLMEARESAPPNRYRCSLTIFLCPPMDRQEWQLLHDKHQRLFAEFTQLKPKLAEIPWVGDVRKPATPEQKEVLDRYDALRREMPKNLPDLLFRSLGLQFMELRSTQPDDAEYVRGPEYREWVVFVKTLDACLRQDSGPDPASQQQTKDERIHAARDRR